MEDQTKHMDKIVQEEERVLARVQRTIEKKKKEHIDRSGGLDYDAELISLRDQIREAHLEDVPPLVEEMERLHQVASRRAKVIEGFVDPNSPYFGRLVLEEDERKREVLIGRSTFLDPSTGVRIVDWRDAPVSKIYYRYEEGDDYEEDFGGREVEGDILVRRSLAISKARLKRVGCPQGTFVRSAEGKWREAGQSETSLFGGQGSAMRPEDYHKPGTLGVGNVEEREDTHLSEITALIDPRQFELITKPTTGLVVIQGGAGSGKTTIGLHRLAYLAFQDRNRFSPNKMLVVVFNKALVRYISRVLPSLGVYGVQVITFEQWVKKQRVRHIPGLPSHHAEDAPTVVTKFKKHPVLLKMVKQFADKLRQEFEQELLHLLAGSKFKEAVLKIWKSIKTKSFRQALRMLDEAISSGEASIVNWSIAERHAVERLLHESGRKAADVVSNWAEILTDKHALVSAFQKWDPDVFTEKELEWIHNWCSERCEQILQYYEQQQSAKQEEADGEREHEVGIDGEKDEIVGLDVEDGTLLLVIHQMLKGPLRGKGGPLAYEHLFVDETQDLSPIELSAIVNTASPAQSITLAGDVAQKLYMDNGFSNWGNVLADLGLDHVEVEPLKLSYRSTHEILEFATDILGPLKNEVTGQATRHGAPVELFDFGDTGEAVGFLAEALRELMQKEPMSSVAVISRYPEQADLIFNGLKRGEVPFLRRISDQDFPFKPGIDVTDIRQVKGLEFDYVVMVEVSSGSYPVEDESRHLLHIGATRAAHQLWLTYSGTPSPILPEKMVENRL